ncbi:hypothetical protein QTN25_001972 [Entamoeba marina]
MKKIFCVHSGIPEFAFHEEKLLHGILKYGKKSKQNIIPIEDMFDENTTSKEHLSDVDVLHKLNCDYIIKAQKHGDSNLILSKSERMISLKSVEDENNREIGLLIDKGKIVILIVSKKYEPTEMEEEEDYYDNQMEYLD